MQHFSDPLLKRMNRKSNSKSIEETINKIREEIPNVILRTTFIVGFPGETEEDFFELYEFVNRAKFEKLGAFKYSKEDGTPAARLKEQVHYKKKQVRYDQIMTLQNQIAKIKLEEKIGNTYEAVVDSIENNGKLLIARSYMDIPNEDGVIYIPNKGNINIGDFINVKITDTQGYDLIGEIV